MRHKRTNFRFRAENSYGLLGVHNMGLRKMQEMPAKKLMVEQNENGEQREVDGLAAERSEREIAEEEALRLSVGYATSAAEEISGDTAISSGLPDGSLALILSDGMGKGIRAAAESRAVARRLRKNLKSGMKPAFAIKEVNRYMLACEEAQHKYGDTGKCLSAEDNTKKSETLQPASPICSAQPISPVIPTDSVPTLSSSAAAGEAECFATVDLLIIDRNVAKAKFYKMGAASSFLLRNGKVKKFEQAALPIGIIPEIRLNHIAVRLKAGDIVVMVSDGITEAARACENFRLDEAKSNRVDGEFRLAGSDRAGESDGAWLQELLERRTAAELAHLSARRLAGEILDEAILRYADRERDDLTVAVVKIL